MTERDHERERLLQRVGATYSRALHAQRSIGSGRVSVHVAPDVWEALRRFMAQSVGAPLPAWVGAPTIWGFPILEEAAWEPGRIAVRVEEEVL